MIYAIAILFAVGTVTPIDPSLDPSGALSQLLSMTHQSWPVAIMLGVYFFLELTLKFGDADGSPIKAWLDKGRRTLVIAGAIAVLLAMLNVLLGGGAVQSAFIAAIVTLFSVWHPQAKEIK